MTKTRFIISEFDRPYENQGLEKHLLEIVEPEEMLLYLWQNRRTVVIGRNQNAWQECKVAELQADGGFLARRISGGGAVYHDLGNLNFTFVCQRELYSIPRQLKVICAALATAGIYAEVSGRNDVLVEGAKVSGNAFYEGRCCFHHGTLLIAADMNEMSRYLQVSSRKLRSKGVSSVRSRVANLNAFQPGVNPGLLAENLIEALGDEYGSTPQELQREDLDAERLRELTQEFSDESWRLGRPSPCTLAVADRFPWGEVELRLDADSGRVRKAQVFTDALAPELAEQLSAALTDQPFSSQALALALAQLPGEEAADVAGLLRRESF